ncbi:MAG: BON domain-containing protein [Polyangiaceae bacterium]|nr:BON domain-containing protein [Polyangiaceae bacterium]
MRHQSEPTRPDQQPGADWDRSNPEEQPHRFGLEGTGNRRLYEGGGWDTDRGVGVVDVHNGRGSVPQSVLMPQPYRKGPTGFRRPDERICEDVCERLSLAEELDLTDVAVDVEGGEVVLTGSVPDRWIKFQIEFICEAVPGVEDITNRLRVRRGP